MVEKAISFIDGSNMFHCGNDRGIRIDYDKLKTFLSSPTPYGHDVRLIRPYFYGSTKGLPHQEKFHEILRSLGYDTRIVPLKKKGTTYVEKGVDVWMAVDMVSIAAKGHCDCIGLVSGDGDFIPAVEEVKDFGIQVVVIAFDHCCSAELKLTADNYFDLSTVTAQIKM